MDGRRSRGYRSGQPQRKSVEEIFVWMKTVGGELVIGLVVRTPVWAYFVAGTYSMLWITNLELSLQAG